MTRRGRARPAGAARDDSTAPCDAGSATPEIVIVLPALMLLLLLGVQLALWGLAAHALDDAVAQGGAALRTNGSSARGATGLVLGELHAIAGGLVLHPVTTTATLPGGTVALSATGTVPSILLGISLRVSATSTGPVQRFRASG